MRNVSANSLFHFTSKFDTLLSILMNDFCTLFSIENFIDVISGKKHDDGKGILMTCFCDIPLTHITKHSEIYGRYAIGLSKEWAFANGISPILYTYEQSSINQNVKSLLLSLLKNGLKQPEEKGLSPDTNRMSSIIQYIKPYKGEFIRNGETIQDYIYYDEREWRYIPELVASDKNPMWFKGDLSKCQEINRDILDAPSEEFKLKFGVDDIKYIIVERESEVIKMIEKIMNSNDPKYSEKDLQKLGTKIISMEQIESDF